MANVEKMIAETFLEMAQGLESGRDVYKRQDINIEAEGKKVNAKGVLGVMGLGAKKGAEITVTVDGEDEEIAAAELETFLKENL